MNLLAIDELSVCVLDSFLEIVSQVEVLVHNFLHGRQIIFGKSGVVCILERLKLGLVCLLEVEGEGEMVFRFDACNDEICQTTRANYNNSSSRLIPLNPSTAISSSSIYFRTLLKMVSPYSFHCGPSICVSHLYLTDMSNVEPNGRASRDNRTALLVVLTWLLIAALINCIN
jgi:hypothetical protein